MTQLLASLLVALAAGRTAVPAVGAQMTSGSMGPAAFMWPPDRVWSAAADNTAPCGSVARPGNRTRFPLRGGKVALVAQDESWDAVLGISFQNDPTNNVDFSTLINARAFRDIEPGHTCVPIANAPSSVRAGSNATLQIKYSAEFDKPEVETFYACADITYVEAARFAASVPCFNATDPDVDDDFFGGPSGAFSGPSDGGARLSGGAIAGIVVGCVAAVAALAAAALLAYRRRQQRQHALRRERSARGVKWEEQSGRDSNSNPSVRMQNLS